MANSRRIWRGFQAWLAPERLVFLDETCLKTNMTTLRGRALHSHRCVDHTPAGRWSTTTLLTAIRSGGVVEAATLAFPGAVNAATFAGYAQEMLVGSLRPGDVVVMDNLACHKQPVVREAIEAVGASVWYLPAYSPDLNPIERAFSKIKQALRRAGARGYEALLEAAVVAMRSVSVEDIRGYMADAGYLTA